MGNRRGREVSRAWGIGGVAAVAGGVLLLSGLALGQVRNDAPANAGAVPQLPASSSQAEETTAPLRAVFIGDSWVGGAGIEGGGPMDGYAGITSKALGWNSTYLTGGGTGYTRGNIEGEGPFIDRAQAAIDAAPDVVIVQGSSNDYDATSATIEAAADALFAQLRAGLPDAKLYVIGVSDSPSTDRAAMDVSREAVAKAAAANGGTFIDSNGWLDLTTDFTDGFHPNPAGHQKVADRLVDELQP
jgi:lysophospholipase L1-like esterase